MSDLALETMPNFEPNENDWGHDGVWTAPAHLPMIVSDEVAELAAR